VTKLYTATFTDAELYQMAYALQCYLGVNEDDSFDDLEDIDEGDASALLKIWDLKPSRDSSNNRIVEFTEDELDGLCEAMSSHIADTEDLTSSDLSAARSAQAKCETRP
jgi:hypothetical protein